MQPIEYVRRHIFRASQIEFASIAGVGQASISRWEAGQSAPSSNHLRKIKAEATLRGIALDVRYFFELPSMQDQPAVAPDPAVVVAERPQRVDLRPKEISDRLLSSDDVAVDGPSKPHAADAA